MGTTPALPVRFGPGDVVDVLDLPTPGHVRTPRYVRCRRGEVVQFCGCFLNPEQLSVGDTSGPAVPLYRVRFRMKDLWPEHQGDAADSLCIEIYDHWLAAATSPPLPLSA